jgi:hypothetical protein
MSGFSSAFVGSSQHGKAGSKITKFEPSLAYFKQSRLAQDAKTWLLSSSWQKAAIRQKFAVTAHNSYNLAQFASL